VIAELLNSVRAFLQPDPQADRIVPPSGFTAQLTVFVSAAMAFLAVFALTLALASGRLAHRWGEELANGATVRIVTAPEQQAAQVQATLRVLESTPGIATARALTHDEHRALLNPWFGTGLDLNALPIPRLIEVTEAPGGFDVEGVRLRLAAEAPGAILDDHARWREPLTRAAGRLRLLGWVSILLIVVTMAAMITLAANAALAANRQVISVLRLVGATDSYIADAYVRRFTLRAATGAAIGTAIALILIILMPSGGTAGGILTGLTLTGWQLLFPLLVPILAGSIAFFATRDSAARTLESLP